jgi:hypothetical protein
VLAPERIQLPGRVVGLAMSDSGTIWAMSRRDDELSVMRIDFDGEPSWEERIRPPAAWTLRISETGAPWIGCATTLREVGGARSRWISIGEQLYQHERLASFVLLPDGFLVSTYRTEGPLHPRLIRFDEVGNARWSTAVPVGAVEVTGMPSASAEPEGSTSLVTTTRRWQPETWDTRLVHDPLVVAGELVIAGYCEHSSGIGRRYCADLASGHMLWWTPARRDSRVAVVGNERFLLGVQGYGAFDTYLYDRGGEPLQHWPSAGYAVVDGANRIRVIEMEDVMPSRMHASVFDQDGTVRAGPHLDGYHTTYPLLTSEGALLFFRDGRLTTIDVDGELRVLYADPKTSDASVMSRMLLHTDGTLVFAVDDELWLLATELAPLTSSPWPCGDGNMRGNPVVAPPQQRLLGAATV